MGATETLYATMTSLIDPGDEAVLISPAFDIYSAQVQMAGGACKYVPLRLQEDSNQPGEQGGYIVASLFAWYASSPAHDIIPAPLFCAVWKLDMAELAAAFSEKTKVLLLNSPQNPTGKCLSAEEYADIRAILERWPRVVVVSDEVYEHMIYEGKPHVRTAAQPGYWDRTLTVSSSGKTFSVTGWKIGWAVGPEQLVKGLILTNQWVQFSVSTPAQHAIAKCLDDADQPYGGHPSYYAWLNAQYTAKRDVLMKGLEDAGLRPVAPEGGFFIIADTRDVVVPDKYLGLKTKACPEGVSRDWALCRFLTEEIKVAAIPPSAFFEGEDKALAANMARFAFCKQDETLAEACTRLQAIKKHLKTQQA